MNLPKNPFQFINLMTQIWDEDQEGLYLAWHNAHRIAQAIGLPRTGGSTSKGGEQIYIYRWPDGQGVRINSQGSSISLASRPHRDAAYRNLKTGVA